MRRVLTARPLLLKWLFSLFSTEKKGCDGTPEMVERTESCKRQESTGASRAVKYVQKLLCLQAPATLTVCWTCCTTYIMYRTKTEQAWFGVEVVLHLFIFSRQLNPFFRRRLFYIVLSEFTWLCAWRDTQRALLSDSKGLCSLVTFLK